jgi:hypothetical protein
LHGRRSIRVAKGPKFPTVPLADVYQIIADCLNHTTQIDAFLSQHQTTAAAPKSESKKRFDPSAFALACWRVVTLDTPIRRR